MFEERVSDDHLCGDCLVKPGKISFARAAGVYDKSLMHMIKAYKYRGKTQTARPFGRLLFYLYYRHYMTQSPDASLPDMVIPVPLHTRRFRERGFNQAWLLLMEWPELLNRIRPKKMPDLVKDGLKRHRPTRPQAGLDKKSRKENIKGAFALSDKTTVSGRHVLLVDDVYTTGTTAEECASVLQKHGARRVDILTLSRAM
jgi:ComF family protein